jgi:hypothetical protein
MSTSPAFEWLCGVLPRYTALSALQARGTVRLMLQDAGIDPRNVRKDQMIVLLIRQLHVELTKRRISHAGNLGSELAALLLSTPVNESAAPDTPEMVFLRLGRS